MTRLPRNIDRWLFEQYRTDPERLALYRILFGCYLLLVFLPTGLWIRNLPAASFSPPVSLAALFTRYPPYWVIVLLNAATLFCVSSLIIGWHTAASSLGVAAGLVIVESFAFADGKIDNTILAAAVPLALAFSGWGAAFSVDAERSDSEGRRFSAHQPWLLATLALVIGFSLLTAGMAKVRGGWLRADALGTRWNVIPNYYIVGREVPLAFWAMRTLPPWIWKSMDYAVVAWETGTVLTVPSRTLFRLACSFGALFHLGVWQLFGIRFEQNDIAYAAFVSCASPCPP